MAEPDEVHERGAFAHAVCRSCAWVGPARRSRGRARKDRAQHLLDGHETTVRPVEKSEFEGGSLRS